MRSAITLGLGILMAAAAPGLRAQAKPATPAGAKPAPAATAKPAPQAGTSTAKPTTPVAVKPTSAAAAKPAPANAKPAAKAAAKVAAKPAAKKVAKGPASGSTAPAESEVKQARRDPFESLVNRQQSQAKANLPPGKAGLQVSTLRLDGVVRSPNGMIAVVSNPQARTYFLREGDHLYDGMVEKISMDGVSFHEEGKDAFGKPVERQVNKRLYSSPGEQQ